MMVLMILAVVHARACALVCVCALARVPMRVCDDMETERAHNTFQ